MTKDFNDWWNGDLTPMDNPYREDSFAYWAWAGWVAGVAAEREACAKLCDNYDIRAKTSDGWIILTEAQRVSSELATKIRARDEV